MPATGGKMFHGFPDEVFFNGVLCLPEMLLMADGCACAPLAPGICIALRVTSTEEAMGNRLRCMSIRAAAGQPSSISKHFEADMLCDLLPIRVHSSAAIK